jgi:hypothetical protein
LPNYGTVTGRHWLSSGTSEMSHCGNQEGHERGAEGLGQNREQQLGHGTPHLDDGQPIVEWDCARGCDITEPRLVALQE